jgi:hypothetical protein
MIETKEYPHTGVDSKWKFSFCLNTETVTGYHIGFRHKRKFTEETRWLFIQWRIDREYKLINGDYVLTERRVIIQ